MRFCLIDAFADKPYSGNPAAVVQLERELKDSALQQIAMEFNQAETAFVSPREDGRFDLRWFTPLREVPLCGHATLAAAHAVWMEWQLQSHEQPIRFVTRHSGELVCRLLNAEQRSGLIAMDFPATPPAPCDAPADAAHVLGVAGPVECVGTTAMNLTLILPHTQQVVDARPDLRTLATWHPIGVTITAAFQPGDDHNHFASRFFAPAAGVDEDPVTGSAHCTLAVIWNRRLNKRTMVGHQLSRRRGTVVVTLQGDRVELRGCAHLTARGTVVYPE